MPKIKPLVTTTAHTVEYREEILRALSQGSIFQPLMILYLTDSTSREEIKLASMNSLHSIIVYSAGFGILGAQEQDIHCAPNHLIPSMILFRLSTWLQTNIQDLPQRSSLWHKFYPVGATTNSQHGVTDIFGKYLPVLKEMARQEMPLLVSF
jgi:dihydroorotase